MTAAEIKTKAEEIVAKITANKSMLEKFKSSPASTVKGLLPSGITDDIVSKIVDAVKAKIGVDNISSKVSAISGLFKK
ncbi:MAG: hypothetical protein MJ137_06420 [Clostridia bacterium]|nr:hypothetical protein [Clostridia bacterium]